MISAGQTGLLCPKILAWDFAELVASPVCQTAAAAVGRDDTECYNSDLAVSVHQESGEEDREERVLTLPRGEMDQPGSNWSVFFSSW